MSIPEKEVHPNDEPNSDSELVDHAISVVESVITYFETLSIYWQKSLNQKINRLIVLLVISIIFLFIICSGLSFIFYSTYQYLLPVFNNDSALTGILLGSSLLFISSVSIYFLIKKMEV